MNKNSIWKRMLSSLLIAVMLVTMLPGMAFADEIPVFEAKRNAEVPFNVLGSIVPAGNEADVTVVIEKDRYATSIDTTVSTGIDYYVGDDKANDGVSFEHSDNYALVEGVGTVTGAMTDEAEAGYNDLKAAAESKDAAVETADGVVLAAKASLLAKQTNEAAKKIPYDSAVKAYENAVAEESIAQAAYDKAKYTYETGDVDTLKAEVEAKQKQVQEAEASLQSLISAAQDFKLPIIGNVLNFFGLDISKEGIANTIEAYRNHRYGKYIVPLLEPIEDAYNNLDEQQAELEEARRILENGLGPEAMALLEADKNAKETALNAAKTVTADKLTAIAAPEAEYLAAKAETAAAQAAVTDAESGKAAAVAEKTAAWAEVEDYINALEIGDITFDPASIVFTKGTDSFPFAVEVYDEVTVTIADGAPAGAAVNPTTLKVFEGETATFTVTPVTNYNYSVEGAVASTEAENTFVVGPVTGDSTVVVSYLEFDHSNIVAEVTGNVESIVIKAGGTDVTGGKVYNGTELTVEAVAKAGYAIDQIYVNGDAISGNTFTSDASVPTYTVSATTKFVGSVVDFAAGSLPTGVGSVEFFVGSVAYNPGSIIPNAGDVTVKVTPALSLTDAYTINAVTVIEGGTASKVNVENGVATISTEAGKYYAVEIKAEDISVKSLRSTLAVTAENATVNVTVNGRTYNGGEFDPGATVKIVVKPADNYFVSRVVDMPECEPERQKGVYTYTFTAGAEKTYNITVVMETPVLEATEGCIINYYDIPNVKEEILEEAFDGPVAEDCTLTYKAGQIDLSIIGREASPVWLAIDSDVSPEGIKEFIESILRIDLDADWVKFALSLAQTDVDTLLAQWTAGLHNFGALDVETVKAEFAGNDFYANVSATSTVTIADLRIETTTTAQNFEFTYGETYTDAEIIELAGVAVAPEEVVWTTDDIKVSKHFTEITNAGTYTVTFEYKGNEEYKPSKSEAVDVIVNKADSYVNITEATVKYGPELNASALIDTGAAKRIEFAAGLYMGADVTADAGTMVYLNLPALVDTSSLPELIRPTVDALLSGLTEGRELTISDLNEYLTGILEAVEGLGNIPGINIDANTVSSLISALEGLEDVAGINEIKIKISMGGTLTLKDAGAYLIGAVVADANYNTSFGVNYAVITPDGYKAELGWNQEDSNGIITGNIVDEFDFGASVVKVHQGTIEGAQAHLKTFFMGVNANGEPTLTDDPSELQFGLYTQLAFIVDAGNTMYYAEPIVRVFTITPQIDTVEVADTEVVYDGTAKEVNVTVVLQDGSAVDENGLKVTYVGVDTQGNAYNSEEPPVNTGVYTVFATYAAKVDGVYEHVGFDAGVLVIKPAAATQTVADTYVIWDGAEHLPTITNDDNLDLIKVIVDENNNVNIVFPEYFGIGTASVNVADPVNDLKAIFEDVSGDYAAAEAVIAKLAAELDKIDVEKLLCIGADKTAAFITDLKADVAEAGEVLAKYDVDAVAAKIADLLGQIDVNTITVNGTLPIEDGIYDVTVVGFGPNHRPAASEGTLTIHKHDVIVDDGDCTTPVVCRCEVVLVAAKSHDFTGEWLKDADGHWHVCQNADCTVTDEKAGHTYATGDTCDACGYERDHVHRLTPVEYKPASCTQNGTKAHYTCSGCDVLFEDAAGTTVITDVTIPAAHSHSQNWSSDETNHWHECVCGDKAGLGTHADNDNDEACDTCGKEMPAPITVTGIAITTPPTKVTYNVGDALDLTGLVVTATYSNNTTADVTSGVTVTGFDSATAGTKTITVTYEGQTVTFNVTVNATGGGGSVTPTPTPTPTPGPTGPVGGGAAPVDPLKPYRDAADKAIDEAEAAEADLYTAIADEIKAIGDDAHAKVKAAKTKEEIFAIEAEAKAKIAELKLVCDVESSYIVARSKCMKAPSGKDSIRIKWYDKYGRVVKFEGVEIFRSTKRNEGYKKMYTSVTDQYYNTAIEIGVKYFYKVRGYVTINGEKVYTDWSLKAIRTAKEL